jgi:soluble lytic murein transglycosylase-like protein
LKKRLFAGFLAAAISAALVAGPADARSRHHRHHSTPHAAAARGASAATQASVAAMIESMAPSYGVPTWFALRIAKVESGFNPAARGTHGELGVFQMKCATARGIGYRGSCDGLLDARTGVDVGLKHLALAIQSSGGNLQLAASKHNGGLGTRHIVHRYVAQVF